MFCASPPPVSPCYGELSPCYGEIISLLLSVPRAPPNFAQPLVIQIDFPAKTGPETANSPCFPPVIREYQGRTRARCPRLKPPLDDPAEFASPRARMEPRRLEMCECGRGVGWIWRPRSSKAQAQCLFLLSSSASGFAEGCSPDVSSGFGSSRIADWSPFSTTTERNLTVFSRHPEASSPSRRRITACVAVSLNMATLVAGLTIVPINIRAGRSGGAGAAGAESGAGGGAAA